MDDKIRTLRPQYKVMRMILNQCDRLNRGKATFTLIISVIIQSLLLTFSMGILYSSQVSGGIALHSLIGTVLFLFISLTVTEILNYGVNVTCARLVEKSYVTLGFLFNGFREKNGRVLRMAAFYTLLNFILAIIFISIMMLFINPATFDMSAVEVNGLPPIFYLGFALFSLATVILKIAFAFVYLILYRRPDCGVFRTISISARLAFKQVFHFVGFLIYAAGKDLLALIVISVASGFFPQGVSASLSLISMLLSCMQIVLEFRVLVRINFALPIYFYSMTGVLQIHLSEYKPPVQNPSEETVVADENSEAPLPVNEGEEKVDSAENEEENKETVEPAENKEE